MVWLVLIFHVESPLILRRLCCWVLIFLRRKAYAFEETLAMSCIFGLHGNVWEGCQSAEWSGSIESVVSRKALREECSGNLCLYIYI